MDWYLVALKRAVYRIFGGLFSLFHGAVAAWFGFLILLVLSGFRG